MVSLQLIPSRLLPKMAMLIFLGLCFVNEIFCYESSGSLESNRVEFAPLYETIIYSDIADVIKDYENNVNSPMEAFINNDENSESDENIEDLLSKYQHYLDKAHKQRRNYVDKSRTKNKVPLLQRDRYAKSHATQTNKHDDYYDVKYYNPTALPLPKSQFNGPLDFLIPINIMRSGLYSNYGETFKPQVEVAKNVPIDKISPDAKLFQLPPAKPSLFGENIQSSCYCDADTFPCECGCRQCLISLDPSARKKQADDEKLTSKVAISNTSYKDARGLSENTINIRVKVDVQFPQVQQSFGNMFKNKSEKILEHGSFSKESNINLPFPLFGLPFPLSEMFGIKKSNRDTAPIHKITIHRKKKSKTNSNGKKHRKKLITFHDFKIEQHSTQPSLDENYNASDNRQKLDNMYQMNQANEISNLTQKVESGNTDKPINYKTNYLMDNITNNIDNTTEDVHRNENSIETEYTRMFINVSTEEPSLRGKREVHNSTGDVADPFQIQHTSVKFVLTNDTIKKSNKTFLDDTELLYWPNHSRAPSLVSPVNITSLILDRENNKMKLNFSTEMIKRNRTKTVEEAIFGKVDWNDVDTVAPMFMSSLGKYIRGSLSFCSDSICHSMKCVKKTCVHRTCAPSARSNNRGHCTGSDATDSVVSMESIMDLPSNIASEIVDILYQNMLGKLFGKATICINSKCIAFTASKKNFSKAKCMPKELDSTGHCPITKIAKTM